MTLLITFFAAIFSTIVWYLNLDKKKHLKLEVLCLTYWGAVIMWFVDGVYEYIKEGAAYFSPDVSTMINDTYLGLSAVALGLAIWLVVLLVKDPDHFVRKALFHKG